jgi:hypothetical protein
LAARPADYEKLHIAAVAFEQFEDGQRVCTA